ncbi:MAG: hypothetical protein A3G84_00675 [Chloroflexi bacterium RIFCSPLOWO2_12_FULL_71_12]|nr:MAG: hypothetical protein A3H36_07040 [Chloroflexi bacterium RIFCSPLOWO2_02_FULL_71_16]OGO73342.1 MAG: hypothetical protein A3G84_00675 [Chloroflexi bacterium RIFCSPLOWO2_12_FULL_71_12]
MREFLEGRRFGFALRPPLGGLALGLGFAVTILDLMAWFGWGSRDTNGFVIGAYWLAIATAIVALLATITSLVEMGDVATDDRSLARLDVAAAGVATLLYLVTAALRSFELGSAAALPLAFLLAIAGLAVLIVGSVLASLLYAAREWEEIEEVAHERHRRRRMAAH